MCILTVDSGIIMSFVWNKPMILTQIAQTLYFSRKNYTTFCRRYFVLFFDKKPFFYF